MEKKLSVLDKARQANGRSRACQKCRFYMNMANIEVCKVCANAFVDGYQKGWKERRL